MNQIKKAWTKPAITIHPAGTEKYEQLMGLIHEQDEQKKKRQQTENI